MACICEFCRPSSDPMYQPLVNDEEVLQNLITSLQLHKWKFTEAETLYQHPGTGIQFNPARMQIILPPTNGKLIAFHAVNALCAAIGCTSGAAGFKAEDYYKAISSAVCTMVLNLVGAADIEGVPGLSWPLLFAAIQAAQPAAQAFQGAQILSPQPYPPIAAAANWEISTMFGLGTWATFSNALTSANALTHDAKPTAIAAHNTAIHLMMTLGIIATIARSAPFDVILDGLMPTDVGGSSWETKAYALLRNVVVIGAPIFTSLTGFAMFFGSMLRCYAFAIQLARDILAGRGGERLKNCLTLTNALAFAIIAFCIYNGYLNYVGLMDQFIDEFIGSLRIYSEAIADVLCRAAGVANAFNNAIRIFGLANFLGKFSTMYLTQTQKAALSQIVALSETTGQSESLARLFIEIATAPPPPPQTWIQSIRTSITSCWQWLTCKPCRTPGPIQHL